MGIDAEWLRALPSLTGSPPVPSGGDLSEDPIEQFAVWLTGAVAAGVAEPHAATLSTIGVDGIPDSRTLILKSVDDRGWAFAGPQKSRKAEQLAAHPVASLNFWWQPIMRAVRVRGRVLEARPADSAADFAARSSEARDGMAAEDWVLWRLEANRVEFWQGAADRRHSRIVYVRRGDLWSRENL